MEVNNYLFALVEDVMKYHLVRNFFCVAIVAVFGNLVLPAQAAIITVNFTAEITAGTTATALGLSGGEAVTGQFTYDVNTPLISTTSTQALYGPDGVPTFEYSIVGGPSASGFPGGVRTIQVNDFVGAYEGVNFFRGTTGSTINGLSPVEVAFVAQNQAGGVLTGLSIPGTLNLSDWPDSVVQFRFLDSGVASYMFADVTSIDSVPLPATAWLFLSALGGLGIIKRRQS